MAKISTFEDLEIWKKSVEIAVDIYTITDSGKISTDFGLRDQLRRAAMSISDNIAEGFEYDNTKDFIKFLRYAKGSAGELRSKLHILKRLDRISGDFYKEMHPRLIGVSKEIAGFIKYLREFEKNKKK